MLWGPVEIYCRVAWPDLVWGRCIHSMLSGTRQPGSGAQLSQVASIVNLEVVDDTVCVNGSHSAGGKGSIDAALEAKPVGYESYRIEVRHLSHRQSFTSGRLDCRKAANT
jgi:hypothetical protein